MTRVTAPVTATTLLTLAREHLANPDNWVRDTFGYDGELDHGPNGVAAIARTGGTCATCAVGAVVLAAARLGLEDAPNYDRVPQMADAIEALAQALEHDHHVLEPAAQRVFRFNDSPYNSHDQVLAAFDRAIAARTV